MSRTGSGVRAAFDQTEKQHQIYQQRYEQQQRERQLEQQRHEFEQYLGKGADMEEATRAAQSLSGTLSGQRGASAHGAPNAASAPIYTWFHWPTMPSANEEQRRSLHAQLRRIMGAIMDHGPCKPTASSAYPEACTRASRHRLCSSA